MCFKKTFLYKEAMTLSGIFFLLTFLILAALTYSKYTDIIRKDNQLYKEYAVYIESVFGDTVTGVKCRIDYIVKRILKHTPPSTDDIARTLSEEKENDLVNAFPSPCH